MMHYWNLLWDWNSIDSVRSVHSALEGWAIILFALLVLFDVLAHLAEDVHTERAKKLERIGLCCFGVAVLAELLAYTYSRRNDELSGTEIRDLSTISRLARIEADVAKIDSRKAKEVAAGAVSVARGARQEADAFETRIISATKTAIEAESHLKEAMHEAAQANQKLGEEIEARHKLEVQLVWRTITPEQAADIKKSLDQWPHSGNRPGIGIKVVAQYLGGDAEGEQYAEALSDALRATGVDIPEPTGLFMAGAGPGTVTQGVLLRVHKKDNRQVAILQRALHDAGIEAPGEIVGGTGGGDSIWMIVGVKPHEHPK